MTNFFKNNKTIVGMIHVDALPGTPKSNKKVADIIAKATEEAVIYQTAGVDMLAIENMHDVPYCNQHVGPEIVAAMAVIGYEIKKTTNLPCGIQILAGANVEAIGVAHAAGLDFVRAEGFVFAHVADEGLIESQAAKLLRYRRQIGADNILVLTDIKKKHSSHAITQDVDIAETARAAEFFLSDGVIVTGVATGTTADLNELAQVKAQVTIPVLVGSGVTLDNISAYLEIADGVIIGSYFKKQGYWAYPLVPNKVEQLMHKVKQLRHTNLEN